MSINKYILKTIVFLYFIFFRSSDGRLLIVSSSDGFCSIVSFSEFELGTPYVNNFVKEVENVTQEDSKEVLNKDTPLKIKEIVIKNDENVPSTDTSTGTKHNEEKQSVDISEPPQKKRVQLVTLSSPKNKKYINK